MAEVKGMPRGTFAWKSNGPLIGMLWKDCKSILFLSSIHKPDQGDKVKRKVKPGNQYQETEFACAKLVNDYR